MDGRVGFADWGCRFGVLFFRCATQYISACRVYYIKKLLLYYMKRLSIIALLVAMTLSVAAAPLRADDGKHLSAIFSYATFYYPETGSYVETYISFDAWNLNFVQQAKGYRAVVEVVLTVSQGDSIEWMKKYDLSSPTIASLDADHFNFIDMQRFALDNGLHDLRIQLRDKNSADEPTVITQQLPLYYTSRRTALSSVQLMSRVVPTETPNILSRGGYDMEPYVNDFVPEQVQQLNYYCELYNIRYETLNDVFSVAYIALQETGKMLDYTQIINRLESDTVVPIFGTMDISKLPSGNYNLVVEIRDRNNEKLLSRSVPFFRSNPSVENQIEQMPVATTFAGQLVNEMQLNDYIEAHAPIANEQERRDIYKLINKPGLEEKQVFLYRFWVRREPLNPEGAWREYRQRIDYVQEHFSWPRTKGIQTDRGRVYLQYGPPDFVRDEKNFVSMRGITASTVGSKNEAIAGNGQVFYLPYQLWRYNNLPADDPDRCFIFWDEFRSGFYKLLHSNARGEVRDAKWEFVLSQKQLPEEAVGEVGEQFERGY